MENKYCIISGGTGGLGHYVVRRALDLGANIILPSRNRDAFEHLKKTIDHDKYERLDTIYADLRKEEDVINVVNSLKRVDILIHLTGGFEMGPTDTFLLENWMKQIGINLTTTFLVCKHALRRMKENGYGRIVTISSRSALEPDTGTAAYSAAKAGVLAFTRAIAAETKGLNITANTVLPSIIDTPANRRAMGEKNIKNWVKPESLAEIICFLASEKAGSLRGAAIPVYNNA